MPNPLDNDATESRRRLTNRELVHAATTSGLGGLGLFTVGLAAVVLLGVVGAMTGEGGPAAAVGVGCVLLLLPAATTLGLGVACLTSSASCAYSLLVGKPVYATLHPSHPPTPAAEPHAAPGGRLAE